MEAILTCLDGRIGKTLAPDKQEVPGSNPD